MIQVETIDRVAEATQSAKSIKWEQFYTEPYPGKDDAEKLEWVEKCTKCGGSGYIACYAGIDGGICYDCVAKGINPTHLVKTTVGAQREKAVKAARKEAAAARKQVREQAKAVSAEEARQAARVGRYPAMHLFTWEGQQSLQLTEWAEEKLSDLRFKDAKWGLSEKQVEFAARLIDEALVAEMAAPLAEARKAQKEAEKVPAPEGRMFVTGTVVKAKRTESYYGYTATTTRKLCIETEEGWTLFVNCPADLHDLGYAAETAEVEAGEREDIRRFDEDDVWTKSWWMVGRKVRMNVTIKRSDRDVAQGFGSRPTKGELV